MKLLLFESELIEKECCAHSAHTLHLGLRTFRERSATKGEPSVVLNDNPVLAEDSLNRWWSFLTMEHMKHVGTKPVPNQLICSGTRWSNGSMVDDVLQVIATGTSSASLLNRELQDNRRFPFKTNFSDDVLSSYQPNRVTSRMLLQRLYAR